MKKEITLSLDYQILLKALKNEQNIDDVKLFKKTRVFSHPRKYDEK